MLGNPEASAAILCCASTSHSQQTIPVWNSHLLQWQCISSSLISSPSSSLMFNSNIPTTTTRQWHLLWCCSYHNVSALTAHPASSS
jgi:hypothetical protein